MKNYQLWGFTYIAGAFNRKNVITGTNDEADEEHEVPCFDGIAHFKFNGKCYIGVYPKFAQLTSVQKEEVEKYCGHEPEDGEYGVIFGALGSVMRISAVAYKLYENMYKVSDEDKKRLF